MISISDLMKYEDGEMSENERTELFQKLIDAGTVYRLQGHYYRTAQALQREGLVHGLRD